MQLLHGCPVPTTEFASLSLLAADPDGGPSYGGKDRSDSSTLSVMGESMAVASPLSTTSPQWASSCVSELHSYLNSVSGAAYSNREIPASPKKKSRSKLPPTAETVGTPEAPARNGAHEGGGDGCIASLNQMLLDDGSFFDGTVQVYRPARGRGVGLHYIAIRDPSTVRRVSALLLPTPPSASSSPASPAGRSRAGKGVKGTSSGGTSAALNGGVAALSLDDATAVVLIVGVSGFFQSSGSSGVAQTLPQRMHDCVSVLSNLGRRAGLSSSPSSPAYGECKRAARSVLSALLLTDEEERKTNIAAEAESGLVGDSAWWAGSSYAKEKKSKPSGSVVMNTSIGAVTKSLVGTKKFNFSTEKKKRNSISISKFAGKGSSSAAAAAAAAAIVGMDGSGVRNASVDVARVASESLAILSVAETDSRMRRYEVRQRKRAELEGKGTFGKGLLLGKSMKSPPTARMRRNRRALGGSNVDTDLAGFDFAPPVLAPTGDAIADGSVGTQSRSAPDGDGDAVAAGGGGTAQGNRGGGGAGAIPMLMAPRKDVSTIKNRRNVSQQSQTHQPQAHRRWMVVNSSEAQRDVRRKPSPALPPPPQQPAFNAFDNDDIGLADPSAELAFANGAIVPFPSDQQQERRWSSAGKVSQYSNYTLNVYDNDNDDSTSVHSANVMQQNQQPSSSSLPPSRAQQPRGDDFGADSFRSLPPGGSQPPPPPPQQQTTNQSTALVGWGNAATPSASDPFAFQPSWSGLGNSTDAGQHYHRDDPVKKGTSVAGERSNAGYTLSTAATTVHSSTIGSSQGSSNRSINTYAFEDGYLVEDGGGDGIISSAHHPHRGAPDGFGSDEHHGVGPHRERSHRSQGQQQPHLPFYAARPDGAHRGPEPNDAAAAAGVPPPSHQKGQWSQERRTSEVGRAESVALGGNDYDIDAGGGVAVSTALVPSPARSMVAVAGESSFREEYGHDKEDVPVPARVLVNIALNEDLACSYRHSRISSCSIEGVVQVQVKSDLPVGVPFTLFVRDPSRHIRTIQEKKEYADNVSHEVQLPPEGAEGEDARGMNHKFLVSVPKADNYFPIMRYKCSSELRPVPIRVQTRVRLHGIFCRVALQISSNPANEDDLTDLTIIMAVPPSVKGETLTTSPPGGVWNAAKRSVLWCVAELGDGEKFQLQAQFEMEPTSAGKDSPSSTEREKPSFPVLVRCQCMYTQLSDIELEVADRPDRFPAEVSMKLARRFRLSHREKS